MTDFEPIRAFLGDDPEFEQVRRQSRDIDLAALSTFVETLRSFGIEHRDVAVEDFDFFAHAGVRSTIESFVADHAGVPILLRQITVVARADEPSDFTELLNQLRRAEEAVRQFSRGFNIDVRLDLYLSCLDVDAALALAAHDATDALNFYYAYADADADRVETLKKELARFCVDPLACRPHIQYGDFPFCFFPPESFPLLYRYAADDLKGDIGAQRNLITDLRRTVSEVHEPCRDCRCRAACYTFTSIGEHVDHAPLLRPRTEDSVVFAGGSITPEDGPEDDDLVWAGPAEQGHLLAAILEGFSNLLIIDGYFYDRFPCTTFEVMMALDQGRNVFGASSIGALRAVELEHFGMVGMGYVFETLKQMPVKPYHWVAQTYDETDRPTSIPLVQIRYFLECARRDDVLSGDEAETAFITADDIHFTGLTYPSFFQALLDEGDLSEEIVEGLKTYGLEHGADTFDVKRRDARELLAHFRGELADRSPVYVANRFKGERNRLMQLLFSRYPGDPDLTLPDDWRADASTATISRDTRAIDARETCARAERFFAGFDMVVADTSKYDHSDQFILSSFFVPFYFHDYYPSSATGNGEIYPEALASAYMELVERAPACGLHIRQVEKEEWAAPAFPAHDLPQVANWGMREEVKQHAERSHGFVRVTDIVGDASCIIPKYTTMFAYSGTDGFAAGNTRAEAVLYGIYECVERDACQMHLLDPVLRSRRPSFQLDSDALADERSRAILAQARGKGCRMVLFQLPTLYGLPCVMCQVYDLNREIQCHGGIAVRPDVESAAYAALCEAYMQYITYFVGTRDDYRSLVTSKQARIQFDRGRDHIFECPTASPAEVERPPFVGVASELAWVLEQLTQVDIEHILVADLSPKPEYELSSVKVIIPRMELWFCPAYSPSPFFAERAQRLRQPYES